MSKTRNERRRRRILLRRIAIVALAALLIAELLFVISLWIDVERYTEQRQLSGPIICITYMPEDFDEEAFEDAERRYAIENGLMLLQGGTVR